MSAACSPWCPPSFALPSSSSVTRGGGGARARAVLEIGVIAVSGWLALGVTSSVRKMVDDTVTSQNQRVKLAERIAEAEKRRLEGGYSESDKEAADVRKMKALLIEGMQRP
ncbi:hypothetical protein A3770_13p70220 [Chloropicon primus]|uniref:Uncharacterized protein n=1 Tax=Chloropicon primus TaxID=1764295 RepID=A0A5B8MYN2_9CHLO|nr:hypothetical protein A3770_13p70220 [Chloropicon primus]|eukprot:QDZ24504.1 hypothetical protein A3770_13p70220 [Chloropicon primus]